MKRMCIEHTLQRADPTPPDRQVEVEVLPELEDDDDDVEQLNDSKSHNSFESLTNLDAVNDENKNKE